ncbi:MAG: DUF1385 domain-containing protein [Ruminococcaceae bacterium]|nr:DUF1385 domain-containing protein [Oscillospiraceae bacterium]
MSENKTKKTSIGGQALIEGIMMRGPEKTAMAVRNTKGEIVLKKWDNPKNTPKIAKLPLIRGVYNMATSLITGYKCLSESAEIAMDFEELERQEAAEKALKELKKRAKKEGRPFEELLAEENAKKVEAADKEAEAAEEISEVVEASEVAHEEITSDEIPEETAETEEKATEITEAAEVKEVPVKEVEPPKKDAKKSSSSDMGIIMVISVALALVLVIGLFVFLPEFIYNLIFGELSIRATYLDHLGRSAFTGLIKLIILVLYMWAVSLMKDIRRTFMYHGAEHKTIFCYEQGLELTVENVRMQKRFHPRCGTSFIVLVVIVGIILGGFIQIDNVLLRTLVRLILVPLIVGIGYELIKFAGRHDNIVTKIISAPGVWLQHITTKEPEDSMIECAIKAVVEVIPEDKEKDNW